MKKVLSVLLSILMLSALVVPALAAAVDVSIPEEAHLAFGEDGKFRILQISDIQDNAYLVSIAKNLIRAAVKTTQPDLIVLTGDNIGGYSCKTEGEAKLAIKQYMDVFELLGVPVAMVFGNHDDQDTALDKHEQMAYYQNYKCFIGCEGVVAEKTVGENTMLNVGTYNIPIFASAESDEVAFNVWCFDSGNYNPDDSYGGYGYVLPEQMDWYVEKSNELKEANGGEPVYSVAFQHIVPPQIKDALKEVDKDTEGAVSFAGSYYTLPDDVDPETNWLTEAPCPPNTNFREGYLQVDTMLQQGDVLGVFFGHDHINSYDVDYEGIHLVSSPGLTYASYNDNNRGVRTITIDINDTSVYETETFLASELLEANPFYALQYRLFSVWEIIKNYFEDLWDRIKG